MHVRRFLRSLFKRSASSSRNGSVSEPAPVFTTPLPPRSVDEKLTDALSTASLQLSNAELEIPTPLQQALDTLKFVQKLPLTELARISTGLELPTFHPTYVDISASSASTDTSPISPTSSLRNGVYTLTPPTSPFSSEQSLLDEDELYERENAEKWNKLAARLKTQNDESTKRCEYLTTCVLNAMNDDSNWRQVLREMDAQMRCDASDDHESGCECDPHLTADEQCFFMNELRATEQRIVKRGIALLDLLRALETGYIDSDEVRLVYHQYFPSNSEDTIKDSAFRNVATRWLARDVITVQFRNELVNLQPCFDDEHNANLSAFPPCIVERDYEPKIDSAISMMTDEEFARLPSWDAICDEEGNSKAKDTQLDTKDMQRHDDLWQCPVWCECEHCVTEEWCWVDGVTVRRAERERKLEEGRTKMIEEEIAKLEAELAEMENRELFF